jgi:hypothetical protein
MLLGVTSFGKGAKHLLRRLAAGQILRKLRVMKANKPYPARTTGCKQGQALLGAQSINQLTRFLDNRQVGGERRIKDPVKSDALESRNEAPGRGNLRRQVELLSVSRTDSGSYLRHNVAPLVTNKLPRRLHLFDLVQGGGGASNYALTAVSTVTLAQAASLRSLNGSAKPRTCGLPHANPLYLPADIYAPVAENAFTGIPDNGR